MKINYATCSGTNETTDIEMLIEMLAEFRGAEIGVQVSEHDCHYDNRLCVGSPRITWIHELQFELWRRNQVINAAMHVNSGWVEDFCQGVVSHELHGLLSLRNANGNPFFQRVQLNFLIGRDRTPDLYRLFELIQLYSVARRFILPYNKENAAFIRQLYQLGREFGVKFDILFDESHGEGIEPDELQRPVFPGMIHGYAGGISCNNVYEVLNKIASIFGNAGGYVNIDAEGKLKDSEGHIDLRRCSEYLQMVKQWRIDHCI